MSLIARIRNLHAGYGRAKVLFGIDLDVGEGVVTTLIGRNGMGKTTTIRCLMGLLTPRNGAIQIQGKDMTGCLLYTSPSPRDRG